MAALGKIRSKAGLLIAVVGIAMLAFIVGDFLTSSSSFSFRSNQVVGEVDGNEIMVNDFQSQVSTFTEFAKSLYGQSPSDGEARDQVWNDFVYTTLLKEEAEKLGLSVSEEELKEAVFGANPHPMLRQIRFLCDENGNFSKTRLRSLLASKDEPQAAEAYKIWLYCEDIIKTNILNMKFFNLLNNSVAPLPKFAELSSQFSNTEYDIAVLKKSYFEVPDSLVSVTDAEINKKYDELKSNFKTEPYRNAKVIVFNVNPSKADFDKVDYNIKITKSMLDSANVDEAVSIATQSSDAPVNTSYVSERMVDPAFKEFAFSSSKGAVSEIKLDGSAYKVAKLLSDVEYRPDSVKASRIVVFTQNKEASQKLADSLMTELNKGASFESFVAKYSADSSSKMNGGDMGWITEGAAQNDEFDEKLFSAKVGDVVLLPIQEFFLILKVTDRTTPIKKVKIAEVINSVEPSNDTHRDVYSKAKEYVLNHRTLKSFEDSASSYGYRVLPLNHLLQNQSDLPMLPQAREIIKWAWNEKTQVGEVSQTVFELDNMFVIASLSDIVSDKYYPVSEVKGSLESYVMNDKKADILINDLKNAGSDWNALGRVDTIKSVSFLNRSVGNLGREMSIIGSICNLGKDAVSAPIKGNSGVYLVKVVDRRDVEPSSANAFESAKEDVRRAIGSSFYNVIKEKADIVDKRYNFY